MAMVDTFTLLALIFALPVLSLLSWEQAIVLLALGLAAALGQICIIQASRRAAASFLAPFLYVSIFYAAVIGVFCFDEMPPLATLIGSALALAATATNMFATATVKPPVKGVP